MLGTGASNCVAKEGCQILSKLLKALVKVQRRAQKWPSWNTALPYTSLSMACLYNMHMGVGEFSSLLLYLWGITAYWWCYGGIFAMR